MSRENILIMLETEVLDFSILEGTGFVDGQRKTHVGRVSYLLAHANMIGRQEDAAKSMDGVGDLHELEDYVAKKYKGAVAAEPHQMLGGGMPAYGSSARGGNAIPIRAPTGGASGSGTIGSYTFDPNRAVVPYTGGRRARSTSRRRY